MKKILKCLLAVWVVLCCLCFLPVEAKADTYEGYYYYINPDGETVCIDGYIYPSELVVAQIPSYINGMKVTEIAAGSFNNAGAATVKEGYAYDNLEKVIIPSTVEEIGNGAFGECDKLTCVEFNYGLKRIGDSAFEGCTSLIEVDLPDEIESIGSEAFAGCKGIKAVNVPGNANLVLGNWVFGECDALERVSLGEGITKIGSRMFIRCLNLQNIVIPNSVERIEVSAFSGCEKLCGVSLPDKLKYIGQGAFTSTNIDSIVLPDKLTSIEMSTFSYCRNLKNVKMNDGLEYIGPMAFVACEKLATVTIPSTVTRIGFSAFSGCSSLTSMRIPAGVTTIEDNIIQNCSGLRSIQVDSGNPEYDSRGNCNAIIETSTNKLISGCNRTVIPQNIESIGSVAFYGCNTIKEVIIPESVIQIGDGAFAGCDSLKKITIPRNTHGLESDIFSAQKTEFNYDVVIYCYKDSDAYTFAVRSGHKYEILDEEDKEQAITDFSDDRCSVIVENVRDCVYSGNSCVQKNLKVAVNYDWVNLNEDYTLTYRNNVNIGTATIYIYGKGKYSGYTTRTFKITPKSINDAKVSGIVNKEYTGKSVTQDGLKIKLGTLELKLGKDYKVTYSNNKDIGQADIIITGIGNYTGTVTKKFVITKINIGLSSDRTVVGGIAGKQYTGKKCTQDKITVKVDGRVLKCDKDYKVTYTNNINAGKATVKITGCGKYMGSVSKQFQIKGIDIAKSCKTTRVYGITNKYYSGKAQVQKDVIVIYGDKILKKDTDYVVKYKNNVKLGKASVVVSGKGNYVGDLIKTFTISLKKNAIYSVGGYKYKVTNAATNGTGTVTLVGTYNKRTATNYKSLTINDSVKIGGVSFKITAIGNKAFYGYKYLTYVAFGKNIRQIGVQTFYGCANLKKIKFTCVDLKTVGIDAFTKIYAKPVVKVPAAKYAKYKTVLKRGGMPTKTIYK